MVVQKDTLEGIQRFLNSLGFQSLDRGRRYFSRGSVLELDCVDPDHLYFASVRGERVYDVQLEFANGKWEADCSCPVGVRCKHIAAAMMALEEPESESDNGGPPVWDRKRIAAVMRNRWQKVRAAALKPPPSPLLNKVVAHLGRDLRPRDRKSTRLNSSHVSISYAVFCLKKKKNTVTFSPFTTGTQTAASVDFFTLPAL